MITNIVTINANGTTYNINEAATEINNLYRSINYHDVLNESIDFSKIKTKVITLLRNIADFFRNIIKKIKDNILVKNIPDKITYLKKVLSSTKIIANLKLHGEIFLHENILRKNIYPVNVKNIVNVYNEAINRPNQDDSSKYLDKIYNVSKMKPEDTTVEDLCKRNNWVSKKYDLSKMSARLLTEIIYQDIKSFPQVLSDITTAMDQLAKNNMFFAEKINKAEEKDKIYLSSVYHLSMVTSKIVSAYYAFYKSECIQLSALISIINRELKSDKSIAHESACDINSVYNTELNEGLYF